MDGSTSSAGIMLPTSASRDCTQHIRCQPQVWQEERLQNRSPVAYLQLKRHMTGHLIEAKQAARVISGSGADG